MSLRRGLNDEPKSLDRVSVSHALKSLTSGGEGAQGLRLNVRGFGMREPDM